MKNKIKIIRSLKYYFYKYGIHAFLPWQKLTFLGHLGGTSEWISKKKNLRFTSFPTKNVNYGDREKLYRFLLDDEIKDQPVDYLEFGVSTGKSFRWFVANLKNPETRFYGFDTFTGLPEAWGPFAQGAMSNGNKPPEIDDTRHQFYQGIFQKTLYDFLKDFKSDKRKILHLDADLYSATLFVLTTFSPYLKKGDILLFDEFNVPMHEYKAFTEWANSFYIEYTVIGEINNFFQVAIRID